MTYDVEQFFMCGLAAPMLFYEASRFLCLVLSGASYLFGQGGLPCSTRDLPSLLKHVGSLVAALRLWDLVP